MTIGQTVEKKIKESGKSIPQVATKAGLSQSTIYNWVYGKAEPNGFCLICIADALGMSLDELVGRTEYQSPCKHCKFHPPSIEEGKPCLHCPAQAKE